MNDPNQQKNKGGRPRKDEMSKTRIEENEIETIFSEIPTGYSVQVHRVEPHWCKGYQGKIYIDGNTPLDLEYIKERYGGRKIALKIVDESAKFKGQKTIEIDAPPKRDYQIIEPGDPHLAPANNPNNPNNPNNQNQFNGFGGFGAPPNMPAWMPPQMRNKILAQWFGMEEKSEPKNAGTAELMQQKILMDMHNSMQTASIENARSLAELRRENAPGDKNPAGDVQQYIALLREFKSVSAEFGGGENSTATEIIAHTAPIIETSIAELLSLQKMKMQVEIAKTTGAQQATAPALPARPAPAPVPINGQGAGQGAAPAVNNSGNGKGDPIDLARQMRAIYDGLSEIDQRGVMAAFLGNEAETEINEKSLDDPNPLDPQLEDPINLLDEEDRAILEGETVADSDQEIQNGEHTGAVETNDPVSGQSGP